jgi:hypothetical protein
LEEFNSSRTEKARWTELTRGFDEAPIFAPKMVSP